MRIPPPAERLTPGVVETVERARRLVASFAPYGHVVDPRRVQVAPHVLPTSPQWEEALYLLANMAAWLEARHGASVEFEARAVEFARRVAELEASLVDA